jgi:hypothetical protein
MNELIANAGLALLVLQFICIGINFFLVVNSDVQLTALEAFGAGVFIALGLPGLVLLTIALMFVGLTNTVVKAISN